MNQFPRITIDPEQMGGVPCIRGFRIPVATVVGMVAADMKKEDILQELPDLEQDDIKEALVFAAQTLKERTIPVAL